jgi:predicted amidophosphoribosyltransferase
MARRSHLCDVCGEPRLGWQRLCDTCFRALPSYLRNAVLTHWRLGDKPAWRKAKKAAKEHLATSTAAKAVRVAQRTAAMLGERDL